MTPLQKTLAKAQEARAGDLSHRPALLGYLDAHAAFARENNWPKAYVEEAEKALQAVQKGATYEDLMKT